jgi:hypothetical protein
VPAISPPTILGCINYSDWPTDFQRENHKTKKKAPGLARAPRTRSFFGYFFSKKVTSYTNGHGG